jgi:hypothetical protein
MLVYQSGIANVFAVDCFNLNPFGRNARRLQQSDFKTCAAFARGLGAAGVIVRTASCNVAGDCLDVQWIDGTDGTPFRDQAADISLNNLTLADKREFEVISPPSCQKH